jgi:hypothetical protein
MQMQHNIIYRRVIYAARLVKFQVQEIESISAFQMSHFSSSFFSSTILAASRARVIPTTLNTAPRLISCAVAAAEHSVGLEFSSMQVYEKYCYPSYPILTK